MKTPPVSLVALADWDEAFVRVESYLRAHQITGRIQLMRITSAVIVAARIVALEQPDVPPVTLAIQVAQAQIGEWLMHAIGEGDWREERFRARARLALLMSDLPRTQAEHFLGPIPPALRERIAGARLYSGPELRLSGMPPAPLDFPLGEAVEKKWVTFSGSTFLRAVSSWVLIAGLLGGVWMATR